MKLTRQQKKKYVKRSRLESADEYICALHKERAEIWEAIDKLPGDTRKEFIKNAGLEWEEVFRTTGQIIGEHMREYIDKTPNLFSVIVDPTRMARIKDIWTSGEFTVPDELDDKPQANQEAQG